MPTPMTCRFSAAQRARAALTDAIGSRITLQPDESGKFLWAEFGLETVLFANITAWPLFTCDDLVRQSRRPVHSLLYCAVSAMGPRSKVGAASNYAPERARGR